MRPGRQRRAPFSIIDRKSDFLYSDRMKGQMLTAFRSFSLSLLGRIVSIVCVTLVLSYIFFEVLDLDGSNFRTHRDPVEINAVVREVETDVIRQLAHRAKPWIEVSFFLLAKPIQWVHRFSTGQYVLPIFYLLHHCGYRTALPRSSIPDDALLSA